jgi:broad specificity phosphatase PhoE
MSFFSRLLGRQTPDDNLRIIITRHGERADLALGPGWARRLQHNGGYDPRISYMIARGDFREWLTDSPLTVRGERQSLSTGRKLLQLGCAIDYCYSSPAYRSIQTANKILEGQGLKAVPINIEPGMTEI